MTSEIHASDTKTKKLGATTGGTPGVTDKPKLTPRPRKHFAAECAPAAEDSESAEGSVKTGDNNRTIPEEITCDNPKQDDISQGDGEDEDEYEYEPVSHEDAVWPRAASEGDSLLPDKAAEVGPNPFRDLQDVLDTARTVTSWFGEGRFGSKAKVEVEDSDSSDTTDKENASENDGFVKGQISRWNSLTSLGSSLPNLIPNKLQEIRQMLVDEEDYSEDETDTSVLTAETDELEALEETIGQHMDPLLNLLEKTSSAVAKVSSTVGNFVDDAVDNAIEGGITIIKTAGKEFNNLAVSPTRGAGSSDFLFEPDIFFDSGAPDYPDTSFYDEDISPMSEEARKAMELEDRLTEMQREKEYTEDECITLRNDIGKLRKDLRNTRDHCAHLQEKNVKLACCQIPPPPAPPEPEREETLSEQMMEQLEVLLKEKAKLASDNARLSRENESLQELLQYKMVQDVSYEDDLLSTEEVELYAVTEEPNYLDASLKEGYDAKAAPLASSNPTISVT